MWRNGYKIFHDETELGEQGAMEMVNKSLVYSWYEHVKGSKIIKMENGPHQRIVSDWGQSVVQFGGRWYDINLHMHGFAYFCLLFQYMHQIVL